MKKPRSFYLTEECWAFRLFVVWPADDAVLKRFVARTFKCEWQSTVDGWSGKTLTFRQESGSDAFVIGLREWKRNDAWCTSVLVHEITHVAHRVLSERGVVLNRHGDAEEAYTYLIDSLTRRCLEKLP